MPKDQMKNNTTATNVATPIAPSTPGLSMAELRDMVAHELRQGSSQESAAGILVARGWPDITARQFVARTAQNVEVITQAEPSETDKRQAAIMVYKRRMVRGVLWMIGGIAIYVASLNIVRSYNGGSFVFFGSIIFGIIDFLAGFVGWWRSRK